ncbi:hypothetical protein N657DRAFT_710303 [Parathielavia appendiculata]|uniref:Uncharacterized protein n=1 Tax=Parathielavia appendiculata TaxID=2587402 RepID=A0AAN6U4U0_9PEZI|nr:hypothetical protein N657DRAFT_710303 [Parathielavia appendiculata]
MVEDKANHEEFKRMLSKTMATTSPVAAKGPVCANPVCGKFGHTLAVCPVPTDSKHGDMTGCFFCNVVEHDADDCPMMEWVSPATLVTHLITNRAGMPPWNTRIDWVALALSEWDLVCFTMLPLTRAFVKKVYIPGRCWKEVNGVSPITEPILKNADRKLLKDLARKAKPGDSRPRRPLMEASVDMCYCRNKCHDDIEHTVFKNEALQKFIPDMNVDEETYRKLMAVYEREVAATQAQMTKKMPKKVTKERKGRRAMKKEAMAAAAAVGKEQHAVAGPTVSKTALTGSIDQAGKDDSSEEEENEKEIPVSQSLLDLTDAVDEVIKNIQKIVKS